MKLVWILLNILLDVAWRLAMIVLAFYLVVAIGMGLYWLFFESAGSVLIGIAVLLIIISVIGATTDNIDE